MTRAVRHAVVHRPQPTNHSCCQTALSILLSYHGVDIAPEEIMAQQPVMVGADGREIGTLSQDLATWCLGQGFDVTLTTCDFQVIDLGWAGLDSDALIARLEAVVGRRRLRVRDQEMADVYVQSYIRFLRAGGRLLIRPWLSRDVLYAALADGPVHFSVATAPLNAHGRTRATGLRTTVGDDVDGDLHTHSVVVHGVTDSGDLLVADPWEAEPERVVEPDRLLAAFASAAFLLDNMYFQLSRRV